MDLKKGEILQQFVLPHRKFPSFVGELRARVRQRGRIPHQNNHPRSIPIHERPGLLLARIRWFVSEAGASGNRAHFFGTELLRGACICLGEFVHIGFGLLIGLALKADCMPPSCSHRNFAGSFKESALTTIFFELMNLIG
jgi:hypothetical protein